MAGCIERWAVSPERAVPDIRENLVDDTITDRSQGPTCAPHHAVPLIQPTPCQLHRHSEPGSQPGPGSAGHPGDLVDGTIISEHVVGLE